MQRLLRLSIFIVLMLWAKVAMSVNDMTIHLFQDGDMVTKSYLAFCKDSDGFLWIGTDTGLLRFDGNQTDLYRNDELNPTSISDNRIQQLFCDSRGRLWVGTVNGLNYFDKTNLDFRRITLPGLGFNGFIGGITELDDGRIIFLVAGIGLYTLTEGAEGDELIVERLASGTDYDHEFSAMLNLRGEGVVVTCRSGQVYILSEGGEHKLLGRLNANPNHVGIESSGDLILASQYEVFRYNMAARTFSTLSIADGERLKITAVYCTDEGTTYFSTTAKGLWELKEGSDVVKRTASLYSPILNLETLKIGSVFKDDKGNLWMGCNHKGVAMVPSKKMPFISKKLDKISRGFDGEITALEVIGERIVVGLTTGNLMVTDLEGNLIGTLDVPGRNVITSVLADGPSSVAVGVARDGIWRLSLDDFKLRKLLSIERPYPGILLSMTGSGEMIAAVSEVGVLKYDPATGRQEWFYPDPNSKTLNTYYYAGVCKTSGDRIWIGGYSGLACYDGRSGQLVPIDQTPFLSLAVHSICDGPDGTALSFKIIGFYNLLDL